MSTCSYTLAENVLILRSDNFHATFTPISFHRVTPQLNGMPESTPTGIEDAGIGITSDGTGTKGEEEGGGVKDNEEEYHSLTGSPDDDIVEATV